MCTPILMPEKNIEVKRIYGTIDNIEQGISRNGNEYYKVYIEGGMLFLWNTSLIDETWIGKDVTIYFEQNGNFRTIKSVFEASNVL